MSKDFEQLPHTADIKIRVYGKTLEELFRNALVGMFQIIGTRSEQCTTKNDRLVCDNLPGRYAVEVSSPQQDLLLADFLSEALFLSDIHNQAFFNLEVQELTETHIRATVHGVDVEGFDTEIKAVTYHELKLQQVDGIWQAEVVFDI